MNLLKTIKDLFNSSINGIKSFFSSVKSFLSFSSNKKANSSAKVQTRSNKNARVPVATAAPTSNGSWFPSFFSFSKKKETPVAVKQSVQQPVRRRPYHGG